jgi:predicted HAD superfamily hydrolase
LDLESMRPRRPVTNLVTLAKALGKRIIYVSDMYYGRSEIEHILRTLDIPLPDHLYVSSAVGHRKDGGAMWHHLVHQEPGVILHFGDNMVSDIQNAADHRINSVFVPTILDKAQMVGVIKDRPTQAAWPIIFPFIESIGAEPFFC